MDVGFCSCLFHMAFTKRSSRGLVLCRLSFYHVSCPKRMRGLRRRLLQGAAGWEGKWPFFWP